MASPSVFPTVPLLELPRCVLRPFHVSDAPALCEGASDPRIVRYMRDTFPHPYTMDAALSYLRIAQAEGLGAEEAKEDKDAKEGQPGGQENETQNRQEEQDAKKEAPRLGAAVHLAICLPASKGGGLVGGVALRPIGADRTDRGNREIGYWVRPSQWGRGLATEAVRELSRWAFAGPFAIERIEANVYSPNIGSARVLERAGYVREGVRRRGAIKNNDVLDVVIFGLVRSDLEPGRSEH